MGFWKNIFNKKEVYSTQEVDNKFYKKDDVDEITNDTLRIINDKIYDVKSTRCTVKDVEDIIFGQKNKEVKFVNKSPNPNPIFANVGDSGFDLRAWIQEGDNGAKLNKESGKYYITLKSLERSLIHTGIYMDIPNDCEVQVRPRSGLALKEGLSVCNTPGTVDTNYVNEVGIIAINLSKKPITIENGDKIAQAVLMPVYNSYNTELKQVDEIKENEFRNMNGFGSSGVK